jgi:anti-anti-sigma factor
MTFQTEIAMIPEMPEAGTMHLRGRVTHKEARQLRKAILGEMDSTTASKVVLELAGVEEMDTSGAAVLAEALKHGMGLGKRVLLCSPSEPVMRIFRLAGFDDVLNHCCSDPQETWSRLQ